MPAIDIAAQNVDLQFGLWAVAATYAAPAGEPLPCTVVHSRPQEVDEIGGGRYVRDRRIVKVRASEVALPVEGGVFVVGGRTLRIVAAPRAEDVHQLVWTCEVGPA